MKLANWKQLKVRTRPRRCPRSPRRGRRLRHQGPGDAEVLPPAAGRVRHIPDARRRDAGRRRAGAAQGPRPRHRRRGDQAFLKQLGASELFRERPSRPVRVALPGGDGSQARAAASGSRSSASSTSRYRLVDPNRAFTRVMPYINFLWSRWTMAVYVALLAFSVYAVAS